ncbi:MAG: T9SS type A sorting domain-containing protein [Bacteroidetes bacterium]|nr:T9SS type A sorting domain-containing protein [Bacteroidota bacterium]
MKIKWLLLSLSLLAIILCSFMPYPGGAPSPYTYTGSPGDGNDCSQCHGNPGNVTGWLTSNVPASGYVPGTTYQITATNSISGSGKYGFECSPQTTGGALVGTLAPGTNSKLVGSGKWVTQSSASNSVTSWTFSWTAPAAGTGNVTFYASFARSTGSSVKLTTLVVSEQTGGSLPAAAGPISGPSTVCKSSNGTYSVGTITGATSYVWSVPAGASITSGSGTTSIVVNFGSSAVSGNVSVYGSNANGNGAASNLAVTVNSLPGAAGAISGNVAPCQGTTQSYSVPNTAGISYTWTVPAGSSITSGQGTNTINVLIGGTSGNVEVVPSNSCGNGTGSNTAITVSPVPAQPSTITGAASVCSGSTQSYYVTGVSGVTYAWSVPSGTTINSGQGSNAINVTMGTSGGSIEVVPSNSCGNGQGRALTVAVNIAPMQPSAVTGASAPCLGSTQSYSVNNLIGVTFNWTVPSGTNISSGQGTNAISVTTGSIAGDITVTPTNECGSGPVQTKAITISLLPGIPAAISGPSSVDLVSVTTSQYATTGATDATSYTWDLTPANSGTIAGTGVTSTVTWNPSYLGLASIKVKAVNTCGDGEWSGIKEVQVSNSTGIIQTSINNVLIYPSPNDGNFSIDLQAVKGDVTVRIMNTSGAELYSKTYTGNCIVPVQVQLASGVYFLMLETGTNVTKSKLVIK